MLVLVTYDVSTETAAGKKRLGKVAKTCVAHGQRVQNSVFECNLDWSQFITLQNKLKSIVDPAEDSLRFYNLGNSYKEKVVHIGIKPSIQLEGELII